MATTPTVPTGNITTLPIITKFVPLKAQAVVAGTPVDVYTPTTGKSFQVLGYALSLSVAGSVLFEDTTGVEFLRTPLMGAGIGQHCASLGQGYLSSAQGNHLFIDVSASGNVSGWIGIAEQ